MAKRFKRFGVILASVILVGTIITQLLVQQRRSSRARSIPPPMRSTNSSCSSSSRQSKALAPLRTRSPTYSIIQPAASGANSTLSG